LTSVNKLNGLIGLSQCGWWWPFEGAVVLTERPVEIHRDEQNRLHNESGAALLYGDGWGVWAVHGVRVAKEIIEQPETISVEHIENESNAEVRRILINQYGFGRYLIDSKSEKIHQDEFGTLYRKKIDNDEDLVMVHVINRSPEPDGTFREFFLRVDPQLRPMLDDGTYGYPQPLTAQNAVASGYGFTSDIYNKNNIIEAS